MSTDIDTMPAGAELDALVSAKVLGRKWDETRCRVCGWPIVPTGKRGCWKDNCALRPRPARRADEPANYSTDLEMAWLVVEHMRAQGWALDSYHSGATEEGHPWSDAIFMRELVAEHSDRAATLPLAICRAALKAVGA
jgi:hypothetical protein